MGGVAWRRCRGCKSVYDPAPAEPHALFELYDGPGYFVKDGQDDASTPWGYGHDYLADREHWEAKFDRVVVHLERYVAPGRLLDVGSGPGFLLTVAERHGWRATGIDINSWAADYGRAQLGVDTRPGDLLAAEFADDEFDALTMMDMVEHVPNPDELLAEAARVVKPGGAVAILTPDSGSPISRLLGARWPEVRRPGEHAVLYSAEGLAQLVGRAGFVACGWHPIGKVASLATLAADVESVAPGLLVPLRQWISAQPFGERIYDFDPRTKLCLYARRLPESKRHPGHSAVRIPKRADAMASVETAILEELRSLAAARGYCDWMFEQFSSLVRGSVAEVGSGIGTFTERILGAGAASVLAIEPDEACARVLTERYGDDPRVTLSRDELPQAPSLRTSPAAFDLVICQNVLEHIGDDVEALAQMRAALRYDGRLALVVPAHPRLFGPLDEAYGHWRRYDPADLEAAILAAGFAKPSIKAINSLGVIGWWLKNRKPAARIGGGSLAAFERILPLWKPLERQVPSTWGLSLVCIASPAEGYM